MRRSLQPKNLQRATFQSTHPRGVRRKVQKISLYSEPISIHAPTRGATILGSKVYDELLKFQSTHPRGVRLATCKFSGFSATCNFNPRTHEGCDFQLHNFVLNIRHFNPRTHEGCDYVRDIEDTEKAKISIHAPTRGATGAVRAWILSSDISIHAPTRGATAFFSLFLLLKDTANHFLKSFVSFSSFYYELVARFLCPALNLISL